MYSIGTEEAKRPAPHYATNKRPAVCKDCGRTLPPGAARIWSQGKKAPWGAACRDKRLCIPRPCESCGGPVPAGTLVCADCMAVLHVTPAPPGYFERDRALLGRVLADRDRPVLMQSRPPDPSDPWAFLFEEGGIA